MPESIAVQFLPLAKVQPNPWNPNRMSERVLEAERESILAHGFIDPITVRPHPAGAGFEIIDGEHRFHILRELLGLADVAHEGLAHLLLQEVVPAIVLDVSDAEARKLTIILNETRGRADAALLSDLLGELAQDCDLATLQQGLPWTPPELAALMPQPEAPPADDETGEPEVDTSDERWRLLEVRVPESVYQLLGQARDLVADAAEGRLHPDDSVAWGQVLEVLVAEYLAMPR